MIICAGLFLVLGILALVVSICLDARDDTEVAVTTTVAVFSIILFVVSTFCSFWSGCASGKVEGLVKSGKYEIVSNEDYSLKELENFLSVNGVYLKEIDNN